MQKVNRAWQVALFAVVSLVVAGAMQIRAQAPAVTQADPAIVTEYWEVLFLQGSRVGHGHVMERRVRQDGMELISVENETSISAKRFGQDLKQTMKFNTLETPDGTPLKFETELQMGTDPAKITGKVDGDTLRLETAIGARSESSEMPWEAGVLGFNALDQTLRRDPLEPGEKRSLKALMPVFNQVAEMTFEAKQLEDVKLLDETRSLLRVETETKMPAFNVKSTLWVDDQGTAFKSESPLMGQVTYRTSREEALRTPDKPSEDLALSTLITVKDMPKNLRGAKQMRYRARLKSGNPAESFVALPWQITKSIDPQTLELTVVKAGPNDAPAETDEADRPTQDDRAPNTLIQSDDPLVRSLAAEGVGDAKTAREKALALEKFVNKKIAKKDFSTAFASAAEVAKSCEGDCTEHGVLLAALLRASEIPARTVVGLVYVRAIKGFGYHMWNEAWIDDRWAPLDATLGLGGTGIGHLALAHSNLAGASPYGVFLPVAQVIGQLEIEVVEE